MSKPTELDIENAKMYIEENELTLGEFIQDLYEMDPADYRKYWGHMDPKELREVLEAEDPTESEPMTDAKWAEITEKSHNDAIALVEALHSTKTVEDLISELSKFPYDTPVRMQRDEFDPKGNSAPEVGLGHDNAVWLS